jgi:hypothetical protein
VEITANRAGTNGGANEHATKTITVTVTDLDDEAPTDIQINDAVFIDGYVSLADDKGANFLIGTLTATDIDTADNELTFITTSTDFSLRLIMVMVMVLSLAKNPFLISRVRL